MFLGKTFAASSSALVSPLQDTNTVQSITIANGIFDELYVSAEIIPMSGFDGIISKFWDFATRLHALFNGNLLAGNIQFATESVEKIRIKKRTRHDRNFQTIFEKEIEKPEDFSFKLMDYFEPVGEIEYMYIAVVLGIENRTSINKIQSKFSSYFLCERDTSYPMCLDREFSKQLNQNVAVVNTWGRKYPLIVKNGNIKYYNMSMSCTFVERKDFEYNFENSWDYRNIIYDFLTNGNPKILKDNMGNIYMVAITGDAITEESDHPLHVISNFELTECGDAYYVGDLYDNNFIDTDIDR